jgi:hypothetical protein
MGEFVSRSLDAAPEETYPHAQMFKPSGASPRLAKRPFDRANSLHCAR